MSFVAWGGMSSTVAIRGVLVLAALVLAWTLAYIVRPRGCALYVPPATRVDQGCINQGNDRRVAAPLVCWAQRRRSWKSDREPRFLVLGKPHRTHMGPAWPPYMVLNSPDGVGHWRVFYLGFRYDRYWRGYIFPTVAWKCLPEPLLY